jgi:AcrR family transcriptional regulator
LPVETVRVYGSGTVTEARVRRSQEERRAGTRAKILDAAADCLLELGYADTTVGEVQTRAGLARGTLLHHFPTKTDLIVAAMEHLAARRIDRFHAEARLVPADENRLVALVDVAWRDLNSPTFFAALELWVAARTDPGLRDVLLPVEIDLFRRLHDGLLAIADPDRTDPRIPTLVEFTIDLLTGLSMTTLLTSNLGHRELLLRRWKRALAVLVGELPADRFVERTPRRDG